MYKDYLATANTRGDADVSVIKIYKLFILKEIAIYQHLSKLQYGETVAHGLVWVSKYFDIEKMRGTSKIEQNKKVY